MFEIHITTESIREEGISKFIDFCTSINVKPIVIELEKGDVAQQPMISKVVTESNKVKLFEVIEVLKNKFQQANYKISRVKIEVPLDCVDLGISAFPNYKGRYFEWHGKVAFTDLEVLKKVTENLNIHISKNSLKGEPNKRFLTMRTYGNKKIFLSAIKNIKNWLGRNNYEITKDEYEYCVFDSNKSIDKGWIETPEITDWNYLNLLAFEGFLRRIQNLNQKFILKGSLLTRQYLSDKEVRVAQDIDFIYGERIDSQDDAVSKFSEWVTSITETEIDDKIIYRSFKENEFWRGIDYAMNDDFPTTNTDLYCEVKKQILSAISLDISWNLPIEEEPIPLLYHPIEGEPFIIPYTIPLVLQISWKLHQTIVRPRTKDLLDILLILDHNKLSEYQIERVAYHFTKECIKDKIDPRRILFFTKGNVSTLFSRKENEIRDKWKNYQRYSTGFGFDFESHFDLKYLDREFKMENKYNNMMELIKEFETKLKEINIAKFLTLKR